MTTESTTMTTYFLFSMNGAGIKGHDTHDKALRQARQWKASHLNRCIAAAVAVGYLRIWSRGPWFVIPGVGGDVTAWCDCLGDDFKPPCWNFLRGNQTYRKPAVWNGPEDS